MSKSVKDKEVTLCDTCKQPLTEWKHDRAGRFSILKDHDPMRCIANMMRELIDSQPNTREL